MKILIISKDIDVHADAVRWGLTQLGFETLLWDWEHFPNLNAGIFSINSTSVQNIELIIQGEKVRAPFDVIWVRRKINPKAMPDCHEDDIKIVEKESLSYLENILPFLGHERTLWINDVEADRIAANKVRQLLIAKEAGFRIPETLIGNTYEQIKDFFIKHNKAIVFKAFSSANWVISDKVFKVQRTSLLNEEHILNDYAIRACPGIYQALIEKKYELRVTVIGDELFAAALDSQKYGPTVDWRYDINIDENTLKSVVLPKDIAEKCFTFCRQTGLQFAAFDFVVDKNDDFVFLEEVLAKPAV